MAERGKLIVIEGPDCSGKQTQSEKLVKTLRLKGIPCAELSFPRYETPSGRVVGECYLGKDFGRGGGSWFGSADKVDPKAASLYYAADRRSAVPFMNELLNSGHNLIVDRYVESNMGHQGGKISDVQARREFINWLDMLEYNMLGLPRPDAVIFLYMPLEVAEELKKGREEKPDALEANLEHLRNAEACYLELAERYNWKKINCAPDKTIKSLRTTEDIHDEIYLIVRKVIQNGC